MKTSLVSKVLAGLALLSISAPVALADDDDRQVRQYSSNTQYRYDDDRNRDWRRHNNDWNRYRNSNRYPRDWRREYGNRVSWNNKSWDWDRHNWNEQRAQMRANWRRRNDDRFSAQQQRLLDEQMRVQWLQYHNNNWNGSYNWDQYNDPQFLDYVHTRNPSLLRQLRNRFGF